MVEVAVGSALADRVRVRGVVVVVVGGRSMVRCRAVVAVVVMVRFVVAVRVGVAVIK